MDYADKLDMVLTKRDKLKLSSTTTTKKQQSAIKTPISSRKMKSKNSFNEDMLFRKAGATGQNVTNDKSIDTSGSMLRGVNSAGKGQVIFDRSQIIFSASKGETAN